MTAVTEHEQSKIFTLGAVRFEGEVKTLHGPAGDVKLEDKVAELLEFLCQRMGDVVSREDILATIWAGRNLSEQTVPVAISKLRKALRDVGADDDLLQTVPKRGYRLVIAANETVKTDRVPREAPVLRRFWPAVAAMAVALLVAFLWPRATPLVPPADAAKPGIILTVQDIRTESEAQEDRSRVIALSELASYFLSQTSEVLVIRHWWNVDAPDPTGGIFTRYGAETPVYLMKGTLLNDGEGQVVTLFLSNPKTDEVHWSGAYDLADGSGAFFMQLGAMLQTMGVSRVKGPSPVGLEDDRYWVGRYLAHLSTAGAARGAEKQWRELLAIDPDNSTAKRALKALAARWDVVEDPGEVNLDDSMPSDDYMSVVDSAALALFRDGNPSHALQLLEQAEQIAPGDHYVLSLKAEALAAQGNTDAALTVYRKALRLAPFAKAYANRIIALEGGTAGSD
ncbi:MULTISPECIES: winged helix-turn-helix domain-containing protein [Kordiimonas]|jgi:DNA-binding winged helix-turn-helix (wHTH) protein/tetratricopeptide (TPR) repeat protein|uniref:winged helix-turn-helix domain-containing protein n=1 Tax=Kordiimonas TaxID=288021 RepID=UPI00257E927A|nr:winged helix-turn-helix domain-containing protein [Kordiimonas sp. UBA4487]